MAIISASTKTTGSVVNYFSFSYSYYAVYFGAPIKLHVHISLLPPIVAGLETGPEFRIKTEFKEPIVASLEIS